MSNYYCPNFSLNQTRIDFENMSSVLGEDYAYFMWNKNKGLPLYLTEENGKEVPNKLYENLVEAFGNNAEKAMLAYAIQNTTKFKKLHPKFNEYSAQKQGQAINEFTNSKDQTLEEVAQEIIDRQPKGFRAEFYKSGGRSEEALVVDRESLRKQKEAVANETETAEEIDTAKEGRRLLNAIIDYETNQTTERDQSTFKPVLFNMQRTINEGKFAEWTRDGIKLYQGSDFTDLYHESFHNFTQRYLTKPQRIALYSIVKNRPGTVKIGGVNVPYYTLTNREVEEVLAEEYRSFAIDKREKEAEEDLAKIGKPETEENVKGVFNGMTNFFKFFFNKTPKEAKDLNESNPLGSDSVMQIFTDLYEGRVSKYTKNDSNITEQSIARSKAIELEFKTSDGDIYSQELTGVEVAEIFDAIDFWISRDLEEQGINFSFLNNNEKRKQIIPVLYQNVKQNFALYQSQIEEDLEKAIEDGDESLAYVLENRQLTLKWILAESDLGSNWDKMVKHHQKFSKGGIFNLKDKSLNDQDQKEDDDFDEYEATRNQQNWDDISVNPEELMSPTVLELLHRLPQIDKQGNYIYSKELGLPTLSDFKANKNLLLKRLGGIREYSKVIETLKGLAKYSPQFEYLIEQLPDPNAEVLTPEELSLKSQFLQSLTMPTVDPYSVRVRKAESADKKNVKLQTTTFLNNTLTTDSLLEFFDQDFRENSNRRFRNIRNQDETVRFNLQEAYAVYGQKKMTLDKDLFDFYYDVFGVDLVQNNVDMFDKKGNYKPNSVPYINDSVLANLRELGAHAHRKLVFSYKLSQSTTLNKQVKDAIDLTNIQNPFGFFATDISKRVINAINRLDNNDNLKIYFKENFKQTTAYSQRKFVFDAIAYLYNDMESSSYLNEENQLEWAVRERSAILSRREKINSANSISELPAYLQEEHNPFVNFSAWMGRIFSEDGTRKIGDNSQPMQLQILNFSGFSVEQRGKKTTNLTSQDKYLQDFLSFIQDGIFENLRFGSKNTSLASAVGNTKKERAYYQSSAFLEEKSFVPGQVETQFKKYLQFELVRIFRNKNGRTRKEKIASQINIFSDIFTDDDLKKELIDLAQNATSEAELLKTFNSNYKSREVNFKDKFKSALDNYFKGEVAKHRKLLADILTGGNEKNLPKVLANTLGKQDPLTSEEVDLMNAYYVTNYMTHQIEFVHILVGDPSNYNIKGNNWREAFKRFGTATSPGKEPLIDDQDLRSRNTNPQLAKKIEAIFGDGSRLHTREYNAVVFNDIETFNPTGAKDAANSKKLIRENYINAYAESLAMAEGKQKVTAKHKERAEKEIGGNVDAFLKQDEEANAQAYATVDFVRYYLDTIGEWSPEQEEAYQHEVKVAQAIAEYRKDKSAENLRAVEELVNTANSGIINTLKLGHYSEVLSKLDETFLGKYSVMPLLPSAVFNTDMEDRMIDMYQSETDMVTFVSAVKMSTPSEVLNYYTENENSYGITKITDKAKIELPIDGLRRQQYLAPKFKNTSTLSSQLVKLLFGDFYEDGKFNSEFNSVKGLAEAINKAQETFKTNLDRIVEAEKSRILINIGAQIDSQGRITKVDFPKFEKWLKSEFDKKDISPSLYDYLKSTKSGFAFSLDASPQRSILEGIIASAISKRIVRPKLFGEAYVQIASSGFNKQGARYKKLTKENIKDVMEEFGVTGLLRDYRVENGVTQPADVAVTFNPEKHAPLLELMFKGERIANISKLNDILLANTPEKKAWVEEHKNKIKIVGVRIPVQGFNSMEYFQIRKFLPTSSGPVIIVPPSIITKSGSDFDIDKLFMYEPSLSEDGELLQNKLRFDKGNDYLYDKIKIRSLSSNKLRELSDILKPKKARALALSKLNEPERQLYQGLYDQVKGFIDESQTEKFFENFEQEATQVKLKILMLEAQQQQVMDSLYYKNDVLAPLIDEFKQIKKVFNEFYEYTSDNVKKVASNNIIETFSDVLSQAALFPTLTRPNNSDVLKGLADKYNKLRSSDNRVTGTSMYLPRISNNIYKEVTLAKKALGIDAKTNALHKLYQQSGLKLTNPSLVSTYLLKAHRKGNTLPLGNYKDVDGVHKISDMIDQFLNGHVDSEKEDWINYFNADKVRTPIILQMLLLGTPIEEVLLVVNQSIVQHYLVNTSRSQITAQLGNKPIKIADYYAKILAPLGIEVGVTETGDFSEELTLENISKDSGIRSAINDFNNETEDNLKDKLFTPEVNNVRETFDEILKGDDLLALYRQVAMFSQYRNASLQNTLLLNLNTAVDFNTLKFRNISDFFQIQSALEEAKEHFDKEGLNNIINKSVVSPFNVSELGLDMYSQMFDVVSNPIIQESIDRFIEQYGQYWDSNTRVVEKNNFLNGFIHSIIQQKGYEQNTNLYQEYGPKSDYLTQGYNPNKSLDLKLAKLKQIEDPQLQVFLKNNMFFKNLSYSAVVGSGLNRTKYGDPTEKKIYEKFYFKVRTNEKDPDSIASIQKAWLDSYNYSESTPEINQQVSDFVRDVALATIMGQGYTIKYRSLQPFIPVKLLPLDGTIDYFQNLSTQLESNNKEESLQAKTELITAVRNFVKVYSIRYDKTKRKQNTVFRKNFPDYLAGTSFEVSQLNINPESYNLGAKLSPNTEKAAAMNRLSANVNLQENFVGKKTYYTMSKGKVVGKKITPATTAVYPIEYENKVYDDVFTAYEDNKSSYETTNTQVDLMKELLTLKFETYPELILELYKAGGTTLLDNSGFSGLQDNMWNSVGENKYMEALSDAYEKITEDMDLEEMISMEDDIEGNESETLAELEEEDDLAEESQEARGENKVTPKVVESGQIDFQEEPTTVKEGVSELFESNPELSDIGTPQQYSQYLDSIFPDSKVKDIVYHGTGNLEKVKAEGFSKSKLKTGEGTNLQGAGFYFAKFKQVLSNYAKGEKGGFVQAIVNLKNPLQERNFPEFLERELNEKHVSLTNVIEVGQKVDSWLSKNNKDGVIWNQVSSFKQGTVEQETAREKLFGTAYNKNEKTLDVEHYSVIEPEQIHILGNKQDIERFKKFVQSEESSLDIDIEDCNLPS